MPSRKQRYRSRGSRTDSESAQSDYASDIGDDKVPTTDPKIDDKRTSTNREPSAVPKSQQNATATGQRSSSATPTMSRSTRASSMRSTLCPISETRAESAHRTKRKFTLLSAVPDSAALRPINRPDNGGTKGQPISVFTNHYAVEIDNNVVIYQYEINIVLIDRAQNERSANRKSRLEVIKSLTQQANFPFVWYDLNNTLYSREILPTIQIPFSLRVRIGDETKEFRLNILTLVGQDRVRNISEFIAKKLHIRPNDTVRSLEILFKQKYQNEYISFKDQFYDKRRQIADLGDGRGMAKGFSQALFLTQRGVTLNVSLAFSCFYMPLQFLDFASKYLRKDITKAFDERDIKILSKLIRNLLIETTHTGRRRVYRFHGFGLSADDIRFKERVDDEEGANTLEGPTISVADYFAKKKYRRLLYPKLPCINAVAGDVEKPNWLPMECAYVVEWQRSRQALDRQQRSNVTKICILKPEERYNEIMTIVRNNQYERDPSLRQLNINVDTREMLQVRARVLPPPSITYRNRGNQEIIQGVAFGKWKIRNNFYSAATLDSWGVISFSDPLKSSEISIIEKFRCDLPSLLKRNGIIAQERQEWIRESTSEDAIRNALLYAFKKKWQLAIVIIHGRNSDVTYSRVKTEANIRIGLMTQCTDFQKLRENIDKLHMYVENLSQKINGKLGGTNGLINLKAALSRSSRDDLFMFFGADVTHSTTSATCPSIAAVVGSRDPTNSLYAARLSEQYPKKGRCSVEIIKELDTMVMDLLRTFAASCGNRLPNKIIFYRDGVDDGQFQKVLDNEVTKIKNACKAVYGNRPLPQVTFIVVKKRHNTRFFVYDGHDTMNLQAGTVIDQDITHPSQFDFYLCSQAAIMGTSRPTLYHVLHDDIGFSSDDIQQLTYWLCHTNMRCAKSVSIPAPVHYAHLAAYAARKLKFGEEENEENTGENEEEPEEYTLDDIKTNVMMLDQHIADEMWFL